MEGRAGKRNHRPIKNGVLSAPRRQREMIEWLLFILILVIRLESISHRHFLDSFVGLNDRELLAIYRLMKGLISGHFLIVVGEKTSRRGISWVQNTVAKIQF